MKRFWITNFLGGGATCPLPPKHPLSDQLSHHLLKTIATKNYNTISAQNFLGGGGLKCLPPQRPLPENFDIFYLKNMQKNHTQNFCHKFFLVGGGSQNAPCPVAPLAYPTFILFTKIIRNLFLNCSQIYWGGGGQHAPCPPSTPCLTNFHII